MKKTLERVWTSNFKERYEALKETHKEFHEESLIPIRDKARRQRIVTTAKPTPKSVVILLWGEITSVVSYSDYQKRCDGFKIVKEIY